MAITVIRNTVQEAIVKITGTGPQTITLSSLVSASQTVSGTPTVDIAAINSSTDINNKITITRNSVPIIYIWDNGVIDQPQYVFREENTSDIVVDLGIKDSTVLLRLNKVAGYSVGPL